MASSCIGLAASRAAHGPAIWPGGAATDDAGHLLSSHGFAPGEYVLIRKEDDKLLAYRVASVKPGLTSQRE